MGDRISRAEKISGPGLRGKDASPRREHHTLLPAASKKEEESGKDPAAAYRGFHRNKAEVLDREFEALLLMMEDGNHKIREALSRLHKKYIERKTDEESAVKVDAVPSVLGYTVGAATQALSDAGMKVSKLTRRAHPRIPAGRVLSQIPQAGSPKEGVGSVHLIVSAGTL